MSVAVAPDGMWAPPASVEDVPTVAEMVAEMDRTVAGLDETKRRLAVVLRRHALGGMREREYNQPNLMVIGPTGGGKSVVVNAACNAAGLPFLEVNATQFSEVGYAGLDVSQMLAHFWGPKWAGRAKRQQVIPLAERFGVVVIDEIDKWAFQPNLKERQPQRVLQAELLRFAEGELVRVRERDSEMGTTFSTHHLLFIGVGAFQSLGRLVDPEDPGSYRRTTSEHIVRYGFLEELAGRFSTIIALPPLDAPTLTRILRTRIWPQYVEQAADDGLTLVADDVALMQMANHVITEKVGARGLVALIEQMVWKPWSNAKRGDVIRLSGDTVPGEAQLVRAG